LINCSTSFYNEPIFNDEKLNPTCRTLHLVNFDYELYRNRGNENRKGKCYIIRKGCHRKDLPNSFDGPIIDELSERERVDVFNKCKYCISYDTQTFYAQIAAYCGCISIVIPEPGKSKSDYLGKGDDIYGVAYGLEDEEIQNAISTMWRARERIDAFQSKNERNVDKFIAVCKEVYK